MSGSAQYAATPKVGSAAISTANTNRDGTGTLGTVYTAGASGARIDKIVVQASGTTTAGMVRLFIKKGRPGVAISSITFVGTTATLTTASAHGLTTGDLVTVQGAFPDDYNVTEAAVTVSSATVFTYTMATTPTLNASTVGAYSTVPASPTSRLWREVSVSAATPSGTVQAFTSAMSSTSASDQGYLPLVLQAGWRLCASTHNAESFNVIAATAGDF